MNKFIPSIRSQLFFIFVTLLIVATMFTRNFFIQSNERFLNSLADQDIVDDLDSLYSGYSPFLPSEYSGQYADDIESLMRSQTAIDLSADLYQRQIESYSRYIFIFVLLSGLLIFLLSLNLITRPLRRLQAATRQLMTGDYTIQIRENRFSPINDLMVSFNKMVRDLNRQQELAIEAEKQLVWREVARVMAHEIKNPLTPIKLSIERLEMKKDRSLDISPALLWESVAIIKEETENLQTLVNRFRGFASLPEARPEKYELCGQLTEICSAYQAQADIHIASNPPHVWINADKIQMKQVFVNIVQNAIQATEESQPHIDITVSNQEDTISITVKDNGPGVQPEDRVKIFEPYFTTKRKGTGLGLPIVKRIIENHNGSISLSSTPGLGTTISINLPANKQEG